MLLDIHPAYPIPFLPQFFHQMAGNEAPRAADESLFHSRSSTGFDPLPEAYYRRKRRFPSSNREAPPLRRRAEQSGTVRASPAARCGVLGTSQLNADTQDMPPDYERDEFRRRDERPAPHSARLSS